MPWPEPGQGGRHALAGAGPGAETCPGRSRVQGRDMHALAGAGPGQDTCPGRSRAREGDMPRPEPSPGRDMPWPEPGQGRRHAWAGAGPRGRGPLDKQKHVAPARALAALAGGR